MVDQCDPKYSVPEDKPTHEPVRLKAIFIHLVKSCGPIEVNRASLSKSGFMYNLNFAFVTETVKNDIIEVSNWRFISQQSKPRMSQIKAEIKGC